jgi:hypothetical protein
VVVDVMDQEALEDHKEIMEVMVWGTPDIHLVEAVVQAVLVKTKMDPGMLVVVV